MQRLSLEDLTSFCIRRGFFFPSGRIYGGFKGFYDYGPLGAEIRKEILDDWWRYFVRRRPDIVGIHGAIITHPRTWEASGHVESFFDYIVTCTRCGKEYRADHLLEDLGVHLAAATLEAIESAIKEKNIKCPECGGDLSTPQAFNLMFITYVGPRREKANEAYLRPETAQLIFTNFKDIYYTMGMKLPFGIAQIGEVFRNEISPRGFLFRLREFTQMEIEYFVNPKKLNECPFFDEVANIELQLLTAEQQEKGVETPMKISLADALEQGYIENKWHAYWIGESIRWLVRIGLDSEHLRVREHVKSELAHYAIQTFDVEYYYPFMGWKEIEGISNRGNYDLRRHQQYSGRSMEIEDDGETVLPYVIEPSFGLERIVLALLTEAYNVVGGRPVLALHPRVAPIKVAVFPIVAKPDFIGKAKEVYIMVKEHFTAIYEEKGTIGRRYYDADEIGVPFAVTIDGQTLEDDTVTIRFRDTKEQVRVPIADLIRTLKSLMEDWDERQQKMVDLPARQPLRKP